MKKLIVFPTWILVRLMIPFLPKNHLWKGKKFTLSDWALCSTELNNAFSIVFWMLFILLTILTFKIFL